MSFRLSYISIPKLILSGFMLLLFVSACNQDEMEEVDEFIAYDAITEWSDTIVKVKYADGGLRMVWGYRDGDTSMHYEWQYYSNGNLWIEGPIYGDIRHGKWKAYNEIGSLISMGTYKMGKKEGVKTVWFDNGKKRYEGSLKEGIRVGVWYFYDNQGNIINEIDYSAKK